MKIENIKEYIPELLYSTMATQNIIIAGIIFAKAVIQNTSV